MGFGAFGLTCSCSCDGEPWIGGGGDPVCLCSDLPDTLYLTKNTHDLSGNTAGPPVRNNSSWSQDTIVKIGNAWQGPDGVNYSCSEVPVDGLRIIGGGKTFEPIVGCPCRPLCSVNNFLIGKWFISEESHPNRLMPYLGGTQPCNCGVCATGTPWRKLTCTIDGTSQFSWSLNIHQGTIPFDYPSWLGGLITQRGVGEAFPAFPATAGGFDAQTTVNFEVRCTGFLQCRAEYRSFNGPEFGTVLWSGNVFGNVDPCSESSFTGSATIDGHTIQADFEAGWPF